MDSYNRFPIRKYLVSRGDNGNFIISSQHIVFFSLPCQSVCYLYLIASCRDIYKAPECHQQCIDHSAVNSAKSRRKWYQLANPRQSLDLSHQGSHHKHNRRYQVRKCLHKMSFQSAARSPLHCPAHFLPDFDKVRSQCSSNWYHHAKRLSVLLCSR